jgi:histidinol-phosphatase (PHP family)
VIADYHVHPRRPRDDGVEEIDHTLEAVERYVEAAGRVGVDEIGFSEHVYYFRPTRRLWTVPYQAERCVYELEPYVDAVVAAKAAGLPVKLGLEVDYVPGREDETRDLLAPYPWDFLLGSVHFVDGLGVDGSPRLVDDVGVEQAWDRYFATLRDAARSALFDVLAHPDLVKIFGHRSRDAARHFEPTADAIAEANVAVEISSAGLHKPVGELYPDPRLLAACRARGVSITLASDAHLPALLGRSLDRAVALAREAGYDTLTVFDARVPRQEPLG